VTWLLFKILSWFEKGPQPTDSVVQKLTKQNDKPAVDIYGRIRDSSHTPIKKDANDETFRYPCHEHESKENPEKAE
jgi:hypothetical protein